VSRQFTLGVLAPFLGGWYFGGILDGIARAAADAGGNVIAFQTLDAGTDTVEVTQPPDPDSRVAWDLVSGFIVVINAVSARYLATIEAAGKPVVVISHQYPGLAAPVVVPDNRTGVRQGVTHLVQHGHRAIGFVGYLGAADIDERYQTYRETLLDHGIAPDPRLLFRASDNHQAGGAHAAQAMLAAGLPSTAVMAGTDANAIGVIATLASAGYHLPADQAVIGFDDLPAASFSVPRLTTVKQPIDHVARTAVGVLLDQVRTTSREFARHHVATSLVVRESCGCSGTAIDEAEPSSPGTRQSAAAHASARSRAQFDDTTHLQAVLSTQYEVSMELLRSFENDPAALHWLSRTSATAGCLGLWAERGPSTDTQPALEIVGVFQTEQQPTGEVPAVIEPAAFPPEHLRAAVDRRPGAVVCVVPVKLNARDLGVLAIVDTVETKVTTGRESISQWTALLAVALDQRAMLAALRARDDQLRTAALFDHLTGLPNRALFLNRLDQAMRRSSRAPQGRFAVLFLDLDGFKVVNDSLGHSAGDEILVQAAERVERSLRKCDTAARFGGDEFLVLLDGFEDGHAPAHVAERLQAALAEPFQAGGQQVVISASIGIAKSGDHYEHAEQLLRDADIAMYCAKSDRKGSHAVFDVTMHFKAVKRLQLETELRQALEEGQFEVHYQPIVDLPTGRTQGFEALVRWRHPERGLLAPGEFLPIAEETGLIIQLSRWVLQQSCQQLAVWNAAGGPDRLTMSVNVADRQFWEGHLIDDIDLALGVSGVDPRCVVLEITEGVIMHDVDLACKMLEEIHSRGCRVHIDDFGTGHSSLEALHRLPIDALKIDRSFVSRLGADARSSELVRTIVLMGHNLAIGIIAEGIETGEQRDHLLTLDCQHGQGYLFSRPIPASDATALMTGR
jgi:diguanylate cyclase (GGDEF)-like protein